MRGQGFTRLPEHMYLLLGTMVVDSNLLHLAGENIRHGADNSHTSSHLLTPKLSPLGRATNDSPRATTLAPPRRTIIAKISKAPPSPIRPRAGPYYIPPSLIISSAFQHQDHRQNETHPSCRARACSHPDQVCRLLSKERRRKQKQSSILLFSRQPLLLLLPLTLPIREARANSSISAHQIQPRW